jgi:hypothetical protein
MGLPKWQMRDVLSGGNAHVFSEGPIDLVETEPHQPGREPRETLLSPFSISIIF